MTTRALELARARRRGWQRLAELTGRLDYADYAADLDATVAKLERRAARPRGRETTNEVQHHLP